MTTTLIPITPTRVINLATILRPFFASAAVSLTPMRKSTDIGLARRDRTTPGVVPAMVRSLPRRPGKLRTLESATITVPLIKGSMSRAAGTIHLETTGIADLALPLGVGRFINVATLKKMLKANRSEVLLRRNGDRWEVCPDSMKIDLADPSVEFRLGPLQIYS